MKILFVCTGNTCRSPIAECLLKDKLKKANVQDGEVSSCGVNVLDGEPLTPLTVEALKEIGIENASHTATIITKESVINSDLIFTMSERQKNIVNNYNDVKKAICLKDMIGEEIVDPFGKDYSFYQKAVELLDKATNLIMDKYVMGIK